MLPITGRARSNRGSTQITEPTQLPRLRHPATGATVHYMGGICERPGCSEVAAAAVAADPRRQIVWLGDLETSAESVNVLCAPHADKLAVPQGWERRDVRDAPRLFTVTVTTAPATTALETPYARRRRSFRKGSPSMADPAEVYYQTRDLVGAAEASPARPARSGETIATGSQIRESPSITQTTAAMESETTRAPAAAAAAARTVGAGGPLAPGAQRPEWDFRAAASMGDLHRVRAELSADTAALLDAGRDTPMLARAFRTARAAG